ncbi:MAG: putative zinc-binding protein [Methanobacterium sp.]|nr:putative zinc-binding protein [Methanobacterium sp.]
MAKEKIAVSPCTGMSPYGLVARAACSDTVNENEDVISICITATSAESGGYKNLIKKYPIIAINGCENACVGKILSQKGVKTSKDLNIMKLLNEEGLKPTDVARLDEEGEKCVEAVKKKIKELLEDSE